MCRHSCGAGRLGGCQLLITCYGACSRSTGQRQGLLKTHIAKCGFGTPNLKGFLPFPALAKMNCEPPSPYTQISTLALEEEVLCKESFLKHEKDWAASRVESKRNWPSDTSSCRIKPASRFCCGVVHVYAVSPSSCHGDHDACAFHHVRPS